MPVVPVLMVASLAMQGVSMYEGNKASKQSAALATATGQYNAKLDEAAAKQIELNTAANLSQARKEGAIYTSRQRAAYASSGVLNTGSPLAVQATTAGRIEQRAQQMRTDSLMEAEQRRAAAKAGILYSDAQAGAIRTSNTANLLRGGANMLSTARDAYQSGAFSGVGADWKGFDSMDFTGKTSAAGFNW